MISECCLYLFSFSTSQGDAQPQPSSQGDQEAKEIIDDGEDESMEVEEDGAGKTKGKTAGSRQNEKLYEAEGILNPKKKRAEKKKRKKANKTTAMEDDDYDFKVDYTKKGSAMDDSGSGDDGEEHMDGIES